MREMYFNKSDVLLLWGTIFWGNVIHRLWTKRNSKPLEEEYERKEKICTNDFSNDTSISTDIRQVCSSAFPL